MKYLLFAVVLFFYGFQCYEEIEFDGSERYRIKGTISDENGNPLKNIGLSFIGAFEDSEGYDALIQKGLTDDKGRFDLIFSNNNVDMYYLEVNSLNSHFGEIQNTNDKYSEKYLFFKPERFVDHEFDLSEHCSLVSGIPLYFALSNTDGNKYYEIDYETKEDIYLDQMKDFFPERTLHLSNNGSVRIIVPDNSKIKLKVNSRDTSFIDSISVTDIPYTYILK